MRVRAGLGSDGDAVYQPELRLTTGEAVPLTVSEVTSEPWARQAAAAVARRLGRPEATEW